MLPRDTGREAAGVTRMTRQASMGRGLDGGGRCRGDTGRRPCSVGSHGEPPGFGAKEKGRRGSCQPGAP